MVRKLLIVILFCLLLAACAGDSSELQRKWEAEEAAQSIQRATDIAMATRIAEAEKERAARKEIKRREEYAMAEMDLIDKQINATITAFTLQATADYATAQAQQAAATATASYQGTATAVPATATAYYPTQLAVNRAIVREENELRRSIAWTNFMSNYLPIAVIIISLALAAGLVLVVIKALDIGERRSAIYKTSMGLAVLNRDREGKVEASMVATFTQQTGKPWKDSGPDIRISAPPVEQLGQGVFMSTTPTDKHSHPGTKAHVITYLEKVNAISPNLVELPGWRDVGISSWAYQQAMSALRAVGAVQTQEGQGAWINTEKYANAGALLFEIQNGNIRIRPALPQQV